MIITKVIKPIQKFHDLGIVTASWYETIGIKETTYFIGIPIYTKKTLN